MKKIKFFVLVFAIAGTTSCKEKESSNNCASCSEGKTTASYSGIKGKIFLNNKYVTDKGDTAYLYGITISAQDFNTETWSISQDSILVPCQLSNEYKKNGLKVVISGNKKDCCGILTQSDLRTGYGCMFEITDIHIYKP